MKLTWLLMALCVRMLRRVWNEIKSWYMRELVRDKGRLEDIIVGNDELVLLSEAKVWFGVSCF